MESKLPEEIKEQIEKEGRAYAKSFGRKEIGYYSLNFIAGATEWAQWKVKYDELYATNLTLQMDHMLLKQQYESLKERCEKMEKTLRRIYDFPDNQLHGKAIRVIINKSLKEGESNTPATGEGQCPEFPHFGAKYPDARCIDGYLWDLDSDENGYLTHGGDDPCPFCNKEAYIEFYLNDEDGPTREEIEQHIETLRKKYQ